jgi:hypothetical protein
MDYTVHTLTSPNKKNQSAPLISVMLLKSRRRDAPRCVSGGAPSYRNVPIGRASTSKAQRAALYNGIMIKKIFGLILILFCTTNLGYAAQPRQANPVNARQAETRSDQTSAGRTDLRTDLDKMQVLLGQMQRNVAFVSTGDTPLKHQFELEIEMWQLLLRDMEKKADEQKLR